MVCIAVYILKTRFVTILLQACNLYTLRHNYFEFTRPLLSSLFPIPQRYYVPNRLRLQYKPRLEAAGLWNAHTEEAEQEKRDHELRGTGPSGPSSSLGLRGNIEIQDAFGREKLLDRARRSLNILSDLLGDKPYFFGDRYVLQSIIFFYITNHMHMKAYVSGCIHSSTHTPHHLPVGA